MSFVQNSRPAKRIATNMSVNCYTEKSIYVPTCKKRRLSMDMFQIMHTQNPIHKFAFSWSIDNFTKIPSGQRSPTFTPVPNCDLLLQLFFSTAPDSLNQYTMDVSLICDEKQQSNPATISGKISIFNSAGEEWQLSRSTFNLPSSNLKEAHRCISVRSKSKLPDTISDMFNLPDDLLTLQCSLDIWGHNITSTASATVIPLETHKELSIDMKSVYAEGIQTDIKFCIGDRVLSAHKCVLIARSPVFLKMLEHDMVEKNSDVIEVKDFDCGVFDLFLKFLYSGDLEDIPCEPLMSLYALADKYRVPSLQKTCIKKMCSLLSTDNVIRVLKLASLHGDDVTKGVTTSYIHNHFLKVVSNPAWAELVVSDPDLASSVTNNLTAYYVE